MIFNHSIDTPGDIVFEELHMDDGTSFFSKDVGIEPATLQKLILQNTKSPPAVRKCW